MLETAGEGGAWGMALLAAYLQYKTGDETLDDYLSNKVLRRKIHHYCTRSIDLEGFQAFKERYKAGLPIERKAVEVLQ